MKRNRETELSLQNKKQLDDTLSLIISENIYPLSDIESILNSKSVQRVFFEKILTNLKCR